MGGNILASSSKVESHFSKDIHAEVPLFLFIEMLEEDIVADLGCVVNFFDKGKQSISYILEQGIEVFHCDIFFVLMKEGVVGVI